MKNKFFCLQSFSTLQCHAKLKVWDWNTLKILALSSLFIALYLCLLSILTSSKTPRIQPSSQKDDCWTYHLSPLSAHTNSLCYLKIAGAKAPWIQTGKDSQMGNVFLNASARFPLCWWNCSVPVKKECSPRCSFLKAFFSGRQRLFNDTHVQYIETIKCYHDR